jgi:hypothetical protein
MSRGKALATDPYRLDRSLVMRKTGIIPDAWQAAVLNSKDPRLMLLCTRQAGKSTVAAALALLTALIERALVLILSPTHRQCSELFKHKIIPLYYQLSKPIEARYQTIKRRDLARDQAQRQG